MPGFFYKVKEKYQGLWICKKLMTFLMLHKNLQGLRRFMLCTADAHGLYQPFGFSEVVSPASLMAIYKANIYENN